MPLSSTPPFLGFGTEENLRAMGDHLPDGLFTIDTAGIVTFWNRSAERITGWTREEALGKDCSLLAGDAVHGCSCGVGPIRCGLAERGRSSKCCTIRTRDGRLLVIMKNAVPILAPDGEPVGALESFTDVGAAAGFDWASAELRTAAPAPAEREAPLVGRHPAMLELFQMISLAARSDAPVVLVGESGSGKDLVAAAIHRSSRRAAAALVRVACSALDDEGELEARVADGRGGTLLLDEIGDLTPAAQARLLRVVEARASSAAPPEVRLLCTTHRDGRQLLADGAFRPDLYFRLNVFPLRVPPLREHREDVPRLAERFLARLGRADDRLDRETTLALESFPWPGNVRELQNVLEYAALRAGDGPIRLEHLPPEVRAARHAGVLAVIDGGDASPAREAERRDLVAALDRCGWSRTRAAEALGISRVTLWKRMKRHGLLDEGGGAEVP
jgi:PAS domain S-box-containing protein